MTLGDRIRANAALLSDQLGTGTLRVGHLRALAADLMAQAAEADRLAEAAAWLKAQATTEPLNAKTAPLERSRFQSAQESRLPAPKVRSSRAAVNRDRAA